MNFGHFPIPREISPGWLSMVLRDYEYLTSGSVVALNFQRGRSFNAQTLFLHPIYSPDIVLSNKLPALPARFLLKRNLAEAWSREAGADEVRFYHTVGELNGHPHIFPMCYAAEHDSASGDSFILLQDVSETHAAPVTREQQIGMLENVPPAAHQNAAIDTLAALHAFWWDHPRLKQGQFSVGHWSRDAERFRQYLAKRQAAWQRLTQKEGARLPVQMNSFYDRLFARLPRVFENTLFPRIKSMRNLTLIHGDSYFCNFLCPRIPGSAPSYLIDWQSPSFDLAAYDLVNLLAAFWSSPQRKEHNREVSLLQRYHQALLARGVQNYSWEDLLADYRLGLIFWVTMPVQDGGDGAERSYWWPKMQCLVAAYQDWDC